MSIDAEEAAIRTVIVNVLTELGVDGRGFDALFAMRQAEAIVKALKIAGYEIRRLETRWPPSASNNVVCQVWNVTAETPRHTYQILMKRPDQTVGAFSAVVRSSKCQISMTHSCLGKGKNQSLQLVERGSHEDEHIGTSRGRG
jgi:hypothetical protein